MRRDSMRRRRPDRRGRPVWLPAVVMVVADMLLAGAGPAARAAELRHLDTGTSSREIRRQAVESLPLDHMGEPERRLVETAVRSSTLYRRLPVACVECDLALLEFVLAKPETLVDIWRVLDISRLSLDPVGPRQWRLSDGYGTVGVVHLLHDEHRPDGGLWVFLGRGGYSGPLSARDLSGACLVVVRHQAAAEPGPPRQFIQIDAFLNVDGLGLEIVTRMLQPLIVYSAATNVREISIFMSEFAAAAERNPAGIVRLTERLPRTDPQDRRALAEAVGAVRPAQIAVAGDPPDEAVQAELASRWAASPDAAVRR
jgi:hypothetical protein